MSGEVVADRGDGNEEAGFPRQGGGFERCGRQRRQLRRGRNVGGEIHGEIGWSGNIR